MIEVEIVVKANFYDLDPMEVVWHGNYARYLEDARCALLDHIGYNYSEMRESGFSWPIVDMQIKYIRPIRFNQKVRIVARLVEYENRIRIEYRIHDRDDQEILTKARTTQVAVALDTQEMSFDSPAILIEKVQRLL